MKIKNIKITNFRNLQKIDIDLKNISVLTGRNGSGKTNLLSALAHSLEIKEQLWQEFNSNVTTKGSKGKSSTTISVTLSDPPAIAFQNMSLKDKINKRLYKPDTITYRNTIGASDFKSHKQELILSGIIEEGMNWEEFRALKKKPKKCKKVIVNDFFNVDNQENNQIKTLEGESFWGRRGNNNILNNEYGGFFFDNVSKKEPLYKFIKKLDGDVYTSEMSSKAIMEYVLSVPSGELYEQTVQRIKNQKPFGTSGDFSKASFVSILADIQCNSDASEKFYSDLDIYTRGLIRSVYIQVGSDKEKIGNDGLVLVETPNAPKWLSSISSGSAILIFFITLKNWLYLPRGNQTYDAPNIILFDEIDSCVHPSLMNGFVQVLRSISIKTQLIFSSHSPTFLDEFSKDEIYYIKPNENIGNINHNRSDILSYSQILDTIDENMREEFETTENSKLFIKGMIDDLYPNAC